MEAYFFRPDYYERYYNCNAYQVEQVPLEQRQHKLLGIGFMTIATIYQVLYVPCLVSISKHMRQNHCYKIMFYIGVVDMLTVVVNGWLTGLFGYMGVVFCSYPRLNYVFGAYALACWCAESSVEVVLALNRCFELWSSDLALKLFGGKKLWIWLGIPTVYGLSMGIWTKPVGFTGIYFSWFFNPHVGYLEDKEGHYENIFHTVHNNVLLAALVITYIAFCIILFVKSIKSNAVREHSFSQKMIFLQVFLISFMNAVAASVYVYMQYFQISEIIIVFGQFCWMNAHGIPPVIYLTMNKSIRNDCKKWLLRAVGKRVVTVQPTSSFGPKYTQQQQEQFRQMPTISAGLMAI